MSHIENTASKSSTVACVFIAIGICLLSRCLAAIREDTQTQKQQGDLISLLLFFQYKESRLKIVVYLLAERMTPHPVDRDFTNVPETALYDYVSHSAS
jgi:Na+/melibiose symporter-like transporter